jgi:endonuclease/exonuclease/phosphatase family metal-dependent hydrolase
MIKIILRIVKVIVTLVLVVAVVAAGYFWYCTKNEWKPQAVENLSISGAVQSKNIQKGSNIKIFSWNIGYGAMGQDDTFILDGGKMSYPPAEDVYNNLSGIYNTIKNENSDVFFFQEVDLPSTRSYNTNQVKAIEAIKPNYNAVFAQNFKTDFTPFPIPPLGFINGGILSLSNLDVRSAQRISLVNNYKWPVRLFQIKRCVLVEKIKLINSTKQLILVNVHLDAFVTNEQRAEQVAFIKELAGREYNNGNNYVVIGGDWNENFPNVAWQKKGAPWQPGIIKKSDIPNKWTIANDATVPTNRSANYSYASGLSELEGLDGFILSPNIKMESIKTLDNKFKFSDHNPVKLSITLK